MDTSKGLVRLKSCASPYARLLCFPHAGAGAATFARWIELTPDDIEVCVLRTPGRESLIAAEPLTSMAELTDYCSDLVAASLDETPSVYFGLCSGAILAYETARRASPPHEPALLAVCSQLAPIRTVPNDDPPPHVMTSENLRRYIAAAAGESSSAVMLDEVWEIIEPAIRADLTAFADYVVQPGRPLSVPILAIRGREDVNLTSQLLSEWASVSSGSCTLAVIPGGHLDVQDRPHEILRLIEREARRVIG